MSGKSTFLSLVGVVFVSILTGVRLSSDQANTAVQAIKDWDLRVMIAPSPLSVKPKSNVQTAIATLVDGNYSQIPTISIAQLSDRLLVEH